MRSAAADVGSTSPRAERLTAVAVHPLTTGVFALLAINDQVLKARYPGLVTGKVSDLAGVAGATLLVSAIVVRPTLAALLVGAAFTALKVVPGCADLVAPLLGGTSIRDATDLVALLVVLPSAHWVSRRFAAAPPRRPRRWQSGSRTLAVAALGAVVLTTTATSCAVAPQVDAIVTTSDGTVFAHVKDTSYDASGNEVDASVWARSDDGGRTYRRASAGPKETQATGESVCRQRCYRVDGSRVEEGKPSGDWRTAFEFTPEQQRRLALRSGATCGWSNEAFLAVDAAERPDGEHVVVAMGTQGVLHRSPNGTWERRAVLDRRPIPLNGPSWLNTLGFTALALPLFGLIALAVEWRRSQLARGLLELALCAVCGFGLLVLLGALSFFGADYTISGPLVAALSCAAFVASIVIATLATRRRKDVDAEASLGRDRP